MIAVDVLSGLRKYRIDSSISRLASLPSKLPVSEAIHIAYGWRKLQAPRHLKRNLTSFGLGVLALGMMASEFFAFTKTG